jgi:Putative restriction endonuclease
MATLSSGRGGVGGESELITGDRMSREEFHRIYAATPDAFHAELIGGIVYVPSPLKRQHGTHHLLLGGLFAVYAARTPGIEVGDNATVLLGEDAEPQPDLYLRLLPESGGQSRTTDDDYILGAPELIAEIAHSSRAIDLHAKKDDYARYGVHEYLVVTVRERRLRWFDLRAGRELDVTADGVARLQTAPGFWVDSVALFANDHARAMTTLEHGLATPEHAEFVRRLTGR